MAGGNHSQGSEEKAASRSQSEGERTRERGEPRTALSALAPGSSGEGGGVVVEGACVLKQELK